MRDTIEALVLGVEALVREHDGAISRFGLVYAGVHVDGLAVIERVHFVRMGSVTTCLAACVVHVISYDFFAIACDVLVAKSLPVPQTPMPYDEKFDD